MKHGAIHHLGSILEVGGRGWVAHLCVRDPPPPLPGGGGEQAECMPSFIAVAQLLLSQPINFSDHPRNTLFYLSFILIESMITA